MDITLHEPASCVTREAMSEPPPPAANMASLPPPAPQQSAGGELLWQARLFGRWLRPKAVHALILILAAGLRSLVALYRLIRTPAFWSAVGQQLGQWAATGYGHLLWQWRALKTNRDRRVAAVGLLGGFLVPLLLFIALAHLLPPPATPPAPSTEPLVVDDSVAAPVPGFDAQAPEEDRIQDTIVALPDGRVTPPAPQEPPKPVELTASNFRFEFFVQRDVQGKLRLLSHVAETYILKWFPLGTPANQLMRFFGEIMARSGSADDASLSAKERCLNMVVGKAFSARTVTCTYSHPLPAPLLPTEKAAERVFWIFALSFDRAGKLTDLRVHARVTLAQP